MRVVDRACATADMLKDILSGVSGEDVGALIEELVRAKEASAKIYFFAAGRANLVMRTFAMRIMQIGLRAHVVLDTITPAMEEGDLLIVASGSGKTKSVQLIVDEAHELGARVALFTKDASSHMASCADCTIVVPSRTEGMKLQTKGSEFEQALFILCDSIGVELCFRLGEIDSIDQIDRFIYRLHANLQ